MANFLVMASSPDAPLTFSLVGTTGNANAAGIDIGGSLSIASGDICFWCGWQWDGGSAAVNDALPTGWTSVTAKYLSGNYCIDLGYKILSGSEGLTPQRGSANLAMRQAIIVYRPSRTLISVTPADQYSQLTAANPASNTINGTNASVGPVIQIGLNAGSSGYTWTNSGFDGSVSPATSFYAGYQYTAGVPSSNCVHDMPDVGAGNGSAGAYFTFT